MGTDIFEKMKRAQQELKAQAPGKAEKKTSNNKSASTSIPEETTQPPKISLENSKNQEPNILLSINGSLNRVDHPYIVKNLAILQPLKDEISRYCAGNDLSVINYLLHMGIEAVKERGTVVISNVSQIEEIYS